MSHSASTDAPPSTVPRRLGGIILCGGRSSRLGINKSELKLGGRTFLEILHEVVGEATDRVVLVGHVDLARHSFSGPQEILADEVADRGPLEGIRVGLQALAEDCHAAFVTSCDVPLLRPAVIRWLAESLGTHEAAIPTDDQRVYGLTAVYRTDTHARMAQRIAANQLRVSDLAEALDTHRLPLKQLRAIDPDLDSLTNINSADDYQALLDRANVRESDAS